MPSKSFKRKNTKGKNKNKNKKAMKTKKAMKKRHSKRNTRGRKMRTNVRQMRGGYTEKELKEYENNLKLRIKLDREISGLDTHDSTKKIKEGTYIFGKVVKASNSDIPQNKYDIIFTISIFYTIDLIEGEGEKIDDIQDNIDRQNRSFTNLEFKCLKASSQASIDKSTIPAIIEINLFYYTNKDNVNIVQPTPLDTSASLSPPDSPDSTSNLQITLNNLINKEITFKIQNENKINEIDNDNPKTIKIGDEIKGRLHEVTKLGNDLLCSIVYTFETKNGKKTGQNNFTYCKNNKCADGKLPDLSSLEPKKQLVTPATLNDTNNTNFFNNVNEKLFSRSQHSTPENE